MNIYQDNQNCFQSNLVMKKSQDKNPKLFDAQEAFMLGNLFKDLYMTYRGFSNYCLQPQSQRQKALLEVQMYGFIAHEINLFLDMHPNNQRMIQLYVEYAKKAMDAQASFEKKYGPLSVQNTTNKVPFEWVDGPWPWEYQC